MNNLTFPDCVSYLEKTVLRDSSPECADVISLLHVHQSRQVNILYYAHSWLRYLVLFVALAALIALAYSVTTGRSVRMARNLSATFAGVLDLQIVLGIALVMGGILLDAVTGHLILMVFAAVVTHASFLIGQQLTNDRRELAMRLAGIVLALALIVVGIMALGQSVLGSSPPPAAYSYQTNYSTRSRCVAYAFLESRRQINMYSTGPSSTPTSEPSSAGTA